MSKDPFQVLADEVTLARQDIGRLQRTSLNSDEAEDLNQVITNGQADMLNVGVAVVEKIETSIDSATYAIREKTTEAAKKAAVAAILETRQESLKVAQDLAAAAGEARKQAWRYFGGFWVWLLAIGSLGAFVGALATMAIQGRADAETFGQFTSIYCEAAGGTKVTDTNGQRLCAVPY